jgi:hypothetical protein
VSEEGNALEGTQLYKPGVLAAYIVLSGLPVGLLLYGINLARRGQRWMGRMVWALAGVLLALVLVAVGVGSRVSGLGLLSIPVAIWVYATERKHYELALQKGARPAKWWPPLFLVLGFIFVLGLTAVLFAPEDNGVVP